jgi:hypothetical protein
VIGTVRNMTSKHRSLHDLVITDSFPTIAKPAAPCHQEELAAAVIDLGQSLQSMDAGGLEKGAQACPRALGGRA